MTNTSGQKRGKQTFRNILTHVGSSNASRLMGRARLANKLAKSLRGQPRLRAYSLKSLALLELTARFPEQVQVLDDRSSPRFVLVSARQGRFGLHAPARLFGR